MRRMLSVLLLLGTTSTAWAEEKKAPTCQESLTQTTVQANNLAHDRAQKEEALAKEQVQTYLLRQKVTQLEQTIEALKHAPKVEEKKAE
jgi:hypothetical protein